MASSGKYLTKDQQRFLIEFEDKYVKEANENPYNIFDILDRAHQEINRIIPNSYEYNDYNSIHLAFLQIQRAADKSIKEPLPISLEPASQETLRKIKQKYIKILCNYPEDLRIHMIVHAHKGALRELNTYPELSRDEKNRILRHIEEAWKIHKCSRSGASSSSSSSAVAAPILTAPTLPAPKAMLSDEIANKLKARRSYYVKKFCNIPNTNTRRAEIESSIDAIRSELLTMAGTPGAEEFVETLIRQIQRDSFNCRSGGRRRKHTRRHKSRRTKKTRKH